MHEDFGGVAGEWEGEGGGGVLEIPEGVSYLAWSGLVWSDLVWRKLEALTDLTRVLVWFAHLVLKKDRQHDSKIWLAWKCRLALLAPLVPGVGLVLVYFLMD